MPVFNDPLLPATAGLALGSPSQPWTLYTQATIVATGPPGPQGPAGPAGAPGVAGPAGPQGPSGLAAGAAGILYAAGPAPLLTGTAGGQVAYTYTLPGGTLSANGAIRIRFGCWNNDMSQVSPYRDLYFDLYWGGHILGPQPICGNAMINEPGGLYCQMEAEIHNNNSLSSQWYFGWCYTQPVGMTSAQGPPSYTATQNTAANVLIEIITQATSGVQYAPMGFSVARIG